MYDRAKFIRLLLSALSIAVMAFCFHTTEVTAAYKGSTNDIVRSLDTGLRVLPPWTPIEITESTGSIKVACWGRNYEFTESILPSQISSQGQSILVSPIKLNVASRHKIVKEISSSIRVVRSSDAVVELEGVQIYDIGTVSSKIRIEYDGLVLITLNFDFSSEPNSLGINIPIANDVAVNYLKYARNKQDIYSGKISLVPIMSEFVPYFWIGDDKKGLFWFCENADNWSNPNSSHAIQVIKDKSKTVQKFEIGNTQELTFGLQATPVKPLPLDWRSLRIHPYPKANSVIPWPGKGGHEYEYHSFPLASNELLYQKQIKNYHSQGLKVIPYVALTRVSKSLPYYQKNRGQWKEGPWKMNFTLNGVREQLVYIDPNSQKYVEFMAGSFTDYYRKYNLDGYYLDGSKLYNHWKSKNGNSNYPILAYRQLHRALYDSIKSYDGDAIIIAHMSGDMNIPVLSYVDAYVDGEQFRYKTNGEFRSRINISYLDVITLAQFRAEFIGKQWGIIPIFLPELGKTRDKTKATKALASLLTLHDVRPWPLLTDLNIWKDISNALDKFHYEDAEFLPYYDKLPAGEADEEDVLVSVYRKGDKALAVISNLSRQDKKCQVSFSSKAIGFVPKVIYSWPSKAHKWDGSVVDIYLAPYGYAFMVLEGK